jgi:YesN/AraC family two-component response regulator
MLLDLQLPDLTGLDLLRRLSNDGYRIPTILMTGHGSEQVAAEAFRLGVHDYLSKPLDETLLTEAITRSLSESRLQREKASLNSQLAEQVAWLTSLGRVGQALPPLWSSRKYWCRIVETGSVTNQCRRRLSGVIGKETAYLPSRG